MKHSVKNAEQKIDQLFSETEQLTTNEIGELHGGISSLDLATEEETVEVTNKIICIVIKRS